MRIYVLDKIIYFNFMGVVSQIEFQTIIVNPKQ